MPQRMLAGPMPGLGRLTLALLSAPLVMGLQRDHKPQGHVHPGSSFSEEGRLRQLIQHRQAQEHKQYLTVLSRLILWDSPMVTSLRLHIWPVLWEKAYPFKPLLGCAEVPSTTASRLTQQNLTERPAGISQRLCMGAKVSGFECACHPVASSFSDDEQSKLACCLLKWRHSRSRSLKNSSSSGRQSRYRAHSSHKASQMQPKYRT